MSRAVQLLWFYERWFSRLLSHGPIPRHIAFIMDGNRRYARKNKMSRYNGHVQGL